MQPPIEGIDYYFENGLIILTEKYLLERGSCCGNGCRHCPYNYENVSEPLRSSLLANKANETNNKEVK